MGKIKIVALYGKAGAGKDAILKLLSNYKENNFYFHPLVSCTTRPPRDGEAEGVAYHFLSDYEFAQKIISNEMLEYTEFRYWFYGTSKSELDENAINIGVFNIKGIKKLLFNNDIDLLPIEITATDKNRFIRQLEREENPDCLEIIRRFQTDMDDFQNFHSTYSVDNNNDIVDTLENVVTLIKGQYKLNE